MLALSNRSVYQLRPNTVAVFCATISLPKRYSNKQAPRGDCQNAQLRHIRQSVLYIGLHPDSNVGMNGIQQGDKGTSTTGLILIFLCGQVLK